MHREFTARPGSTWADYSARRLIAQRVDAYKPEAERFAMPATCF
jgi:hypothetical protein